MKYNPNTIYVLDDDFGTIRILCENENFCVTAFCNNSNFRTYSTVANEAQLSYLIMKCGYTIIQEWN